MVTVAKWVAFLPFYSQGHPRGSGGTARQGKQLSAFLQVRLPQDPRQSCSTHSTLPWSRGSWLRSLERGRHEGSGNDTPVLVLSLCSHAPWEGKGPAPLTQRGTFGAGLRASWGGSRTFCSPPLTQSGFL